MKRIALALFILLEVEAALFGAVRFLHYQLDREAAKGKTYE